ncbi:MAG TPA: hypothetical protein VJ818_03260 [Actinomycetota bacterium]|nr:hypothetical protein [Actinomycetota bacterium]
MDSMQGGPATGARTRTPWFVVLAIFAVGLVAGLIISNLNIAGAQTPSPSPNTPGGKMFRGFGHRGFGPGGGIHGQFTVPAPNGGYETILTQIGTVDSVSSSSITVKSEDGYTHTYSVDNNTLVAAGNNGIADVAKGDTVRVLAVGNAAKQIVDATKVQSLRQKYWGPRHENQAPAPSGSPTASNTSANV